MDTPIKWKRLSTKMIEAVMTIPLGVSVRTYSATIEYRDAWIATISTLPETPRVFPKLDDAVRHVTEVITGQASRDKNQHDASRNAEVMIDEFMKEQNRESVAEGAIRYLKSKG